LAALLHTGRLPPAPPDPARAWKAVDAMRAYEETGLWQAGGHRDGKAVFAVGRASRSDVAERVFDGMAKIFGIPPQRYRLISVGPEQAWRDLWHIALRRLGCHRWARRLELALLAQRWTEAAAAVQGALRASTDSQGRRTGDGGPPKGSEASP
jgi:hypothetical protein